MLKRVQHDGAGESLRPLRETSSLLVKLVANVTILTLAAMNDNVIAFGSGKTSVFARRLAW